MSMALWIAALRERASSLKSEVEALLVAIRDPRVPWWVRGLGFIVLAYAVSPIDLIPDFIPVLGLVDDLVIVPAGVVLLRRLIPDAVMADARSRRAAKPSALAGGLIVGAVWMAVLVGIAAWLAWMTGSGARG
jgi:uncharacterized membrane protein YkvA (DUF1232 family)